jgi:predicted RNA-binding Zn ribbon-like protein
MVGYSRSTGKGVRLHRSRMDHGQPMLIAAVPEDLCLSYANTLSWRGSDPPTEALRTFADLLAWLDRCVGAGAGATRGIARWASRNQKAAAELFAEAIGVREAIFRIFRALAAGETVREQDFAALRAALVQAPVRRLLAHAETGYGWRLAPPEPTVPALLAPVLWSAADLMVAGERRRIRQCANEKCRWLFLDASKNDTRRWCDMASCGNRAKARRHYHRSKEEA